MLHLLRRVGLGGGGGLRARQEAVDAAAGGRLRGGGFGACLCLFLPHPAQRGAKVLYSTEELVD